MNFILLLGFSMFVGVISRQGSLQAGGYGGPPIHFEILPNQKLNKFICFLYIMSRIMWLAPKDILSNQVENKILALITKPSKILERTQSHESQSGDNSHNGFYCLVMGAGI